MGMDGRPDVEVLDLEGVEVPEARFLGAIVEMLRGEAEKSI